MIWHLRTRSAATRGGARDTRRELRVRTAFTIVELLVVIAIIGVLVALLMPAVQAARETARRAQCQSHLKELGLAVQHHETAQGHYPTGGWGCSWTGDPERGTGERQPGGWIYNILPYMEQTALHDKGVGSAANDKLRAAAETMQIPLALLNCPTRRTAQLYPNAWPYVLYNAAPRPTLVARSDYAINAGDSGTNSIEDGQSGSGGPATLSDGDQGYPWLKTAGFTGISFLRSSVTVAQVTDGTTKTYLVGESYVPLRHYDTGLVESDRGHMFSGMAPDTVRMAQLSLAPGQDGDVADKRRFGSAHGAGCNFVFCDGSVRLINYDIDPAVHRGYGNRKDSGPVN